MVVYMRIALENQNNSHSRYVFKHFIAFVLLYLIADMSSYIFDMQTYFSAKFFNHLSMFASVSLTAYIGYLWNRFFDVVFGINNHKRLRTAIYLLPFVAVTILLFANLFTEWLFIIDENNVYSRGQYAYVSFFLQYVSFGVLAIRAIVYRFSVKTIRYLKLRNSFIWLGMLTMVFGVFQIIAQGEIALQCLGMTASIFIMFLRFQDDQITNDLLTGLNNRYALDTYLEDKIKLYASGAHAKRKLYLIMMDINYFKRINDMYGHIEGDEALKTVAETLKKIGSKHKSDLFIARFGGDEFSSVFESTSENEVKKLCLEIKETLKSNTDGMKYLLTMGVGYARYTGKSMSLASFYELADKALYDDKDRMKGNISE